MQLVVVCHSREPAALLVIIVSTHRVEPVRGKSVPSAARICDMSGCAMIAVALCRAELTCMCDWRPLGV